MRLPKSHRWTFDDMHIGVAEIEARSFAKGYKILPRPPRLTTPEWHSYAGLVCSQLNGLERSTQTPRN